MKRIFFKGLAACLAFSLGLVFAQGKSEDKKAAVKKGDEKEFIFIDIQPQANQKLKDNLHTENPGNSLASLKTGEQTMEGVKFKIGEKCIQLGSMTLDKPEKVEGIKVEKAFTKLHILHATGYKTDEDKIIGEYTINWDDGSSVTIPIVYGKDVLDWWYTEDSPEPTRAKVAWKGENEYATSLNSKIRLYLTTWENPKPDKKVKSIEYSSTKETQCAPFCLAMSLESK